MIDLLVLQEVPRCKRPPRQRLVGGIHHASRIRELSAGKRHQSAFCGQNQLVTDVVVDPPVLDGVIWNWIIYQTWTPILT